MKYFLNSTKDRELVNTALYYNMWLLLGRNDTFNETNQFLNLIDDYIQSVTVYPFGTTTLNVNKNQYGNCIYDFKTNKISIYLYGLENSEESDYIPLLYNAINQFHRAFLYICPQVFSSKSFDKVKDDTRYSSLGGQIFVRDNSTLDSIGNGYYGKAFSEVFSNMVSLTALYAFDSHFIKSRYLVDNIFTSNVKYKMNVTDNYEAISFITRLIIASLSNTTDIKYQDLIENGYGMYNVTVELQHDYVLKANDFVYAMLCDPMMIELEFDKFMGKNNYRAFAKYLDTLYESEGIISSDAMISIISKLKEFAIKRFDCYYENGYFSINNYKTLIANFDNVVNSMPKMYLPYYNDYINNSSYAIIPERKSKLPTLKKAFQN